MSEKNLVLRLSLKGGGISVMPRGSCKGIYFDGKISWEVLSPNFIDKTPQMKTCIAKDVCCYPQTTGLVDSSIAKQLYMYKYTLHECVYWGH